MQKDLKDFAKAMQKLAPNDRLYWLQSMAHCREIGLSPTTWPARFYKSFVQIEEDYRRFKGIIVDSLSALLTDKREVLPVVKKGVDAFMWASDKERKEFYQVVQAASYQVTVRVTNPSDHGKKCVRKHERKVNVVIIYDPATKKSARTRE